MSFLASVALVAKERMLARRFHVSRPHGILAETSMNATVHASPRRLSTWDGGQCKDAIITIAPRRQAADGGVSVHCSCSGYGYCPTQASCVVAL
jgi:hypothetical protein